MENNRVVVLEEGNGCAFEGVMELGCCYLSYIPFLPY